MTITTNKPDIIFLSLRSQIISLIPSCTWHIVDLDTSKDVLGFLEQFQDVLPKSDHYFFIMNSHNIFYKEELLNFFSHNFFRKVILNWKLNLDNYECTQVLNAVALAENPSGQFYVQINRLENSLDYPLYDIWNGTRFLLDRNMFPEKLDNFQGKVLK